MNYRVEWITHIDQIEAKAWNALLADDHPFVRYEFLSALEQSQSLRTELGWRVQHLTLWSGDELVAAAPSYLKTNSHGEFVFDWNWAQAYERAGLSYYPKLLCAVPYSPVTGPRLLAIAGQDADRTRFELIKAITTYCTERKLSSAHLNFPVSVQAEHPAFVEYGWLRRFDWQFHWTNRGYHNFEDFLSVLNAKKRKNIRQERAKLRNFGLSFQRLRGEQIDTAVLSVIYRFYANTFRLKGNIPALTQDFFVQLLSTMPKQILVITASRNQKIIGAAFCLQSKNTLYGRYWGCNEEIPGLHFECCYYQGIEHCIAEGLECFEPGAQGEHKIARGFLPVRTHSLHYLHDLDFRRAIADYLKHEAKHQEQYQQLLLQHSPFAKTEG